MAKAKKEESFYDLLVQAVSTQEAGHKFYIRANEISKVPLAKVTLSGLAEDELKHKVAILRFCKQKDVEVKAMQEEFFGLPMKDLERQITAYTPLERIYKFAMDFERRSCSYYTKLKPKTNDREALRLLDFLVDEESRHYKLLSGTLQYLTRPAEWFAKEEKPVVEG